MGESTQLQQSEIQLRPIAGVPCPIPWARDPNSQSEEIIIPGGEEIVIPGGEEIIIPGGILPVEVRLYDTFSQPIHFQTYSPRRMLKRSKERSSRNDTNR